MSATRRKSAAKFAAAPNCAGNGISWLPDGTWFPHELAVSELGHGTTRWLWSNFRVELRTRLDIIHTAAVNLNQGTAAATVTVSNTWQLTCQLFTVSVNAYHNIATTDMHFVSKLTEL